jgi:hypothetical protein
VAVSAQDIINKARTALGVGYVWGGNSLSSGVDCSGLVQQVYGAYGIQLPRVTYDQINVGASVPISKLSAGDLVFFDTDAKKSGPDHVGIYIGGGKFIHAPRPGQPVKISSLGDSYYADRLMAGRRIPGVATGPGGGVGPMELVQPKLESTELAERYGMSLAFFQSVPELDKLLKEAVKGQWTDDRFQGSLKNTKWWRENSDSVRKQQVLAKTDPASYKASLEAQKAALGDLAVKMGAILTKGQLDKLARDALAYQWNDAQVQSFLGKYIKFREDKTLGGLAGTAAKEITGLAHELGIRLSEQTVKNYAAYVVRGVSTMQDVQTQLRQQAAGALPGFADQILAGDSVRDLADPYIQMMAEELELADTSLDLHDTVIRNAMSAVDRKGAPAPMSMTDFQREVRSDPRWRQTSSAREQTMSTARQVLSSFGFGG